MTEPISPFLRAKHNYLEQAAVYLEARGLTIQDTPVITYIAKNQGLVTEQGAPYILEGWGFCIKDKDGNTHDGEYIMRVCNYPDFPLFQGGKEWVDRPKFVQTTRGQVLHYAMPEDKVLQSSNIMIHEKLSSAALAVKTLGIPALAISGCAGWGKGGELNPALLSVVRRLKVGARIVVCYDGDILSNPTIMSTAQMFKAAVSRERPDIVMSFPLVPDMQWGVGWDDWAAAQPANERGDKWVKVLAEDGIPIYEVLRLADLVADFGVSTCRVGKSVHLEQTRDNYARLLKHYRWCGLRQDILGGIYRGTDRVGSRKEVTVDYLRWMERSVCAGYGSKVRTVVAEEAMAAHLLENKASIVLEILKAQPPIYEEQARESAECLISEGIEVIGPMTHEETIETVMRIFRDIAGLWGQTPILDIEAQWILALVGPTGCGKTNFFDTIVSKLPTLGYTPTNAQLEKEGSRANLTEYNRATRDSHVAVFDEYNPNDLYARTLERDIFTLVSKREFSQRKLYEEDSEMALRHAFIGITTTDKHRQYIRSAEGTGERRFITLEVRGVKEYAGIMSSNREIIANCGLTLLTWAAQRGEEVKGGATEFSTKYTTQFIREANIFGILAEQGFNPMIEEMGKVWYRAGTEDYRFCMPQMRALLANSAKLSSADRNDLTAKIEQCGAARVGKGRINDPKSDTGEVMKDLVYAVKDWAKFCDILRSKF